jgi:hypothetical protein
MRIIETRSIYCGMASFAACRNCPAVDGSEAAIAIPWSSAAIHGVLENPEIAKYPGALFGNTCVIPRLVAALASGGSDIGGVQE